MDFLSHPPYIIAEVGGNHGGDVDRAERYLREAAQAGADAVKFQYYHAERLITKDQPPLPLAGEEYESQYERFRELELTRSEWEHLATVAAEEGVDFALSVFDRAAADFAASHCPFIKIASGDLTNLPLLRYVASLDTPVVLSTGFATMDEIDCAVEELNSTECCLLHCMGSYPTEPGDANLQLIDRLSDRFDLPIGYSDHTIGLTAPIASVALGAHIVEKHFTLDKSREIGDHRLSATPEEMESLVARANDVWKMFGTSDREAPFSAERTIRTQMRRSLASDAPIAEGETFTTENLTALRPEGGLSPLRYDEILGRRATRDIDALEVLDEAAVDLD